MRKRNRSLAFLLVGAMTVSAMLAGCGSKSETPDTDTPKETAGTAEQTGAPAQASDAAWDSLKEDTIVLSVINNYYTAGQKKLAEEYMELHPETKVVVDVVSDNDAYMTKMQTAFSADQNDAPDIVHGNFVVNALTASSWNVAFEKGYLTDLAPMLDEVNPYNDGKLVRDVFDPNDLAIALNKTGGSKMGILPFDKIGVAFFYNKDIFEKEGVAVPETFEDLIAACETFQSKGYQNPIAAGLESSWFLNSIADSGYRTIEDQFLTQPGDAVWDEATMTANEGFKWDPSNLKCDKDIVNNDERIAMYRKENSVNTELNKTIWDTFSKVAKFFPENWVGVDSNQMITDFEMGNSPMLLQGSFNAGKILDDINQLPADKQFQWSTFQFPSFKDAPQRLENTLRGLFVLGNEMAVVQKDSEDHMARVKDFYKFWYSPKQAQTTYEETLASGNFIQGPSVIAGVTLSAELQEKLDGFVPEGTARDWDGLTGFTRVTQADMPKFYDLVNSLSRGKIDAGEFLEQLKPYYDKYSDEGIASAGFDLDPATLDTAK